jgi:hypothetical protein
VAKAPRIRPRVEHYHDAQRFRWFDENPDLLMYLGLEREKRMWAVYQSPLDTDHYARVEGLQSAVDLARKLKREPRKKRAPRKRKR